MLEFALLMEELTGHQNVEDKTSSLCQYFNRASDEDSVCALALLLGKRPKKIITHAALKAMVLNKVKISDWLFGDSLSVVGDLIETISLIYTEKTDHPTLSLSYVFSQINIHSETDNQKKRDFIFHCWQAMRSIERVIFNKIITGSFRVTIQDNIIINALGQTTGIPAPNLSMTIFSDWDPERSTWNELFIDPKISLDATAPFMFMEPEGNVNQEKIRDLQDWIVEPKWDGIRAQLVSRKNTLQVWSKSGEILTHKFPEMGSLSEKLPDNTVIDGEIIAFHDNVSLNVFDLKSRFAKTKLSKTVKSQIPVTLVAFDMLEFRGKDYRQKTLVERRNKLDKLVEKVDNKLLTFSENLNLLKWEALDAHFNRYRKTYYNGLVLKRKDSPYQVNTDFNWQIFKPKPFQILAVLIYWQRQFSPEDERLAECTFAVWQNEELIPITKCPIYPQNEEIEEMEHYVKTQTIERFGPVKSIQPGIIYDISFEDIYVSNRHKSGIMLRSVKALSWNKDIKLSEIHHLSHLKSMLRLYEV